MRIILIKDVRRLGLAGDIINVKDGYGRNYLLPQGFAVLATKDALKKIEAIKEKAETERSSRLAENKAKLAKISEMTFNFLRKSDDNGNLYGSVSENDIVAAIAANGVEINRANVIIRENIKMLGEVEVEINLGVDLVANIKVIVEREN